MNATRTSKTAQRTDATHTDRPKLRVVRELNTHPSACPTCGQRRFWYDEPDHGKVAVCPNCARFACTDAAA